MPQENVINDKTIKLYVGGIDPSWSNEKVSEILSKHGKVIRTDVVKNYAFAVRLFDFIQLCIISVKAAKLAISHLFSPFGIY